jgi:hypothetical protein
LVEGREELTHKLMLFCENVKKKQPLTMAAFD